MATGPVGVIRPLRQRRTGPGAGRAAAAATAALRYGRRPLLILTAVSALDQADRFLLSTVYPLLQQEFHLSDTQLGALSSAFTVVGGLAVVPFGILVDRRVRTRVVAWATAVWSTALIVTGLAGSYTQLLLSRMFHGTSEAAYGPGAFSLISDYYPPERRGMAYGIWSLGAISGYLVLPIGALIASAWSWRAAFHAYAIPGFLLALVVARLPEPARGGQDVEAPGPAPLEAAEAGATDADAGGAAVSAGTDSAFARMPSWTAVRQVLRTPTILVLLASSTMATFFLSGLGVWAVTFFVRYHDMTLVSASSVIVLLGVGALVGAVAGGKVGDRLISRGVTAGRIYAAGGAQLIGILLLFPAFSLGSLAGAVPFFALGAITLTFPMPNLTAARAEVLHPDLRGRAASVFSLLNVVAGASSPLLFGVLSDGIGLRVGFLALLPGLTAGGLILALWGPRFYLRDSRRMREQVAGREQPGAPAGGTA